MEWVGLKVEIGFYHSLVGKLAGKGVLASIEDRMFQNEYDLKIVAFKNENRKNLPGNLRGQWGLISRACCWSFSHIYTLNLKWKQLK